MVRKMRGGSQAHLLEAADGRFYVVKFLNNPQHRRILINEWISAAFMSFLGLSTPGVAMIRITEEFLKANPDVYMQLAYLSQFAGVARCKYFRISRST
ncbi:MAG TPA: HipA family kinase [Bryobacteraceae bacterium]